MGFWDNSWRLSQSCITSRFDTLYFEVRKWNLDAPSCLNFSERAWQPENSSLNFYACIWSLVLDSTLLSPDRTQSILQEIMGVFNRNCMITYAAYRDIFPIWALGEYRQKLMSWACAESWTHHGVLNLARFSSLCDHFSPTLLSCFEPFPMTLALHKDLFPSWDYKGKRWPIGVEETVLLTIDPWTVKLRWCNLVDVPAALSLLTLLPMKFGPVNRVGSEHLVVTAVLIRSGRLV